MQSPEPFSPHTNAQRSTRRVVVAFVIACAALAWSGCATPPQAPKLTERELVQQDSINLRPVLDSVEKLLKVRSTPGIEAYLKRLAERLIPYSAILSGTPVEVKLIANLKGKWRSFGVPALGINRVYLPLELVKNFAYETELASLLALELTHLANRDATKKLEADPTLQEKAFEFDIKQLQDAVSSARSMLYQAGFDGRGLSALWARYREDSAQSPYARAMAEEMMVHTKKLLAAIPPLRNPTTRSEDFIKIKDQIGELQ